LCGKKVLITGGARRIGRALALAMAREGADVVVHHGHRPEEAQQLCREIAGMGRQAEAIQADLDDPAQAEDLVKQAAASGPLFGLVNNAAVFESLKLADTDLAAWERHLRVNLTAPFLISRAFVAQCAPSAGGRIVNILDWRALRPGRDHFPYTVSKAALAAMTRILALELAPAITVNGLALGAILPASDGSDETLVLKRVPAGRRGELGEVAEALLFLLAGPAYVTGEILHVDGGRHLA